MKCRSALPSPDGVTSQAHVSPGSVQQERPSVKVTVTPLRGLLIECAAQYLTVQ